MTEETTIAPVEQAVQATPESAMPEWYVTEQLPGSGNKPEYLLDKFTNLGEQAKAFVELEKRMGGFKGAPKDGYNLEVISDRLQAELPPDAPLVKSLMDTAKSLNMSQEGFEKFMESIVTVQKSFQVDPQEELRKLGPDAEQQIGVLKQWAENNFAPEDVAVIQDMLNGPAEQIRVLQKMRTLSPKSSVPTASEAATYVRPTTQKELQAELAMNLSKYESDPRYRAEFLARLEKAV